MAHISYSMFIISMILVTLLTYGLLWWLFFRDPDMMDSPDQSVSNAIPLPSTAVMPTTSTAMKTKNDDTMSHDMNNDDTMSQDMNNDDTMSQDMNNDGTTVDE